MINPDERGNDSPEMQVLGGLMESEQIVPDVLAILQPEHFYKFAHRDIYRAIQTVWDEKKTNDPGLVLEELRRAGNLTKAGGAVYLLDLRHQVINPLNASYFAHLVKEAATKREALAYFKTLQERIGDEKCDLSSLFHEASDTVAAFVKGTIRAGATPFGEAMQEAFDILQHRAEGRNLRGLDTGIQDLDDLTTGLKKGELCIVASRPSVGKTSLCLNILRNISVQKNIPCLFFSLEMRRLEIVVNMLALDTQIDSAHFRSGKLSEEEFDKVKARLKSLKQAPLYIGDKAEMHIADLRGLAGLMKEQHGIGLVIVDYLQLITPTTRNRVREQEVAELSRGLKLMARELDLPVIVCAQINRAGDEEPGLQHLRESGAIEADADVVVIVHRDKDKDGLLFPKTRIRVAKNRNGQTGAFDKWFEGSTVQFRECMPTDKLAWESMKSQKKAAREERENAKKQLQSEQ